MARASLDRLEGETIEGASLLVLLTVGLLALLGYLAWKDISIPAGAYPDSIWNKFSSWVDDLFGKSPIAGGSMQNSVDNWLAKIWIWINGNLPRSVNAKNWNPNAGEGSGSISTGSSSDGSVAETSNGSGLDEYQFSDAELQQSEQQVQQFDNPGTPIDPYAGLPEVQLPRI